MGQSVKKRHRRTGAAVEVAIDGQVVGTTTVNADGTWTLDLTEPLTEGEHSVTAIRIDEAGNVSVVSGTGGPGTVPELDNGPSGGDTDDQGLLPDAGSPAGVLALAVFGLLALAAGSWLLSGARRDAG